MLTTRFSNRVDSDTSVEIPRKLNNSLIYLLEDLRNYRDQLQILVDLFAKVKSLNEKSDRTQSLLAQCDTTVETVKRLIAESLEIFKSIDITATAVDVIKIDIRDLIQEFSQLSISEQISQIYQEALLDDAEPITGDGYFHPGFVTVSQFFAAHPDFANRATAITTALFALRFDVTSDIEYFITQYNDYELNEDEWYFIFDFVKSSQASKIIENLLSSTKAFIKELQEIKDFNILMNVITSLYGLEVSELTFCQKFILDNLKKNLTIPDNVMEILSKEYQYKNLKLEIHEEIPIQLFDIEQQIVLQKRIINQANIQYLDALEIIMASIKRAAGKAAYDYDVKNVRDKNGFYYIFHGKTGQTNVENLTKTLDDPALSSEQKLDYLANFLSRHEPKGFFREIKLLMGRGLHTNSYDTRFITHLFNEGFPTGLFGYKDKSILTLQDDNNEQPEAEIALPVIPPAPIETVYTSISGIIPRALTGDNRLNVSSDRNEILRCTATMFSKIKKAHDDADSQIAELRTKLLPSL
jgi:hypothetical protein